MVKKPDGPLRAQYLARWHRSNAASYSWRTTDDPWAIFLAEFLLRRTRAEQVEAVLVDLRRTYPSPAALATASVAAVREALRSAGLSHRVEQLHAAAKQIVACYEGAVPLSSSELQSLPGVGPYVSQAVSSRLSGEPVLLVDTNTVRVSTRVLGVEPRTKDPRREKQVVQAIADLFGGPDSIEVWWATIDLAHLVCRPRNPECGKCPLRGLCDYADESDALQRYAAEE